MDDRSCRQFFLQPQQTFHRRYEALRAIVVDREPLTRVAKRYGYKDSALKSMICRFRSGCRRGATPPFFFQTVEDDPRVNVAAKTDMGPSCQKSPTAEG